MKRLIIYVQLALFLWRWWRAARWRGGRTVHSPLDGCRDQPTPHGEPAPLDNKTGQQPRREQQLRRQQRASSDRA